MNAPIIRFEVQNMQHTLQIALSRYAAGMDQDIQNAVAEALTPENVLEIVRKQAAIEIKMAIESEISKFYRYGKGSAVLQETINKTLSDSIKESEDGNDAR